MKDLLKLALPVVLGYLGIMAMHFVDLIFVGRLGASSVAAVGLGSSVFAAFMMFGLGVISALEYLVGHAEGSGDFDQSSRALAQGFWVSLIWGVLGCVMIEVIRNQFGFFKIDPSMIPEAMAYLKLLAPSLPLVLAFTAMRTYRQAKKDAIAPMVILITANVINALANALWVWGLWGAPKLGVEGSALATSVSRIFMVACLAGWILIQEKKLPYKFELKLFKKLISLGIPAGLQATLEVGVFSVASGLASQISSAASAAHQLALNFASMTFMVPLGVGSAAAVLISRALGAKNPDGIKSTAHQSLILSIGFMTCMSALLIFWPTTVLSLYTTDIETIQQGTAILMIAGIFQIFDGTQATLTGILRGMGDTQIAVWANGIGHWCVGLPLAIYFGASNRFALSGIWSGLCAGLITVAFILAYRYRVHLRTDVEVL
jgi:MATE family multidrug resistance protein